MKLSALKREKSTPSKFVLKEKTDDSLDCSVLIQQLKAGNRILMNRLKDLEFEKEELQIQNEILTKHNSESTKQSSNSEDGISIDDLKQTIISLKRQNRDEEEKLNYSQFLLEQKEADIEFLQLEIGELKKNSSYSDELTALDKQLKAMQKEIKNNEDRLTILRKEEADSKDSMKKKEMLFSKSHNTQKLPPSNWIEDRNAMLQQQQTVQHKISHLNEKQRELFDHLTALKAQFYFDFGVDEKELKKILFAELECNSNPVVVHLQNAIAAEIEYNNILEAELNEVREATDYIKKYRETCFKRGKNQYELESSRKRIELLQDQLNRISQSFST